MGIGRVVALAEVFTSCGSAHVTDAPSYGIGNPQGNRVTGK